jgi:hypothetical protein
VNELQIEILVGVKVEVVAEDMAKAEKSAKEPYCDAGREPEEVIRAGVGIGTRAAPPTAKISIAFRNRSAAPLAHF